MNPPATADDADLSLDDWRRVDSACDRFEAAWRAGERPDPAPLLTEVTKPARARLLRELLIIELESRRKLGERPDVAEYAGRFPEDLTVVDGVFLELGLSGETLTPLRKEGGHGGNTPWQTVAGAGWLGAEVTPAEIGTAANERLRAAGYEIIGELGRGGMGVVYLARKVALNRPCALKMILAGTHGGKSAAARFRVEAEAVARIRHPGIVQIYHVGEADGLPFLELEYLPGGSLEKMLDGTPRPSAEAARLVETLARAIAEAHRRGIVHRDLKPANILMDAGGQPKVADFGLAKIVDSDDGLTKTNLVIGSPSYMAPEQAEGNARSVGMTVDVYALGAILYELLTGRPPFRAATALETLEQVKAVEPVPPSRFQPGLPRNLETICLKCLEKSPSRRYATSEALAEDLRRHLAGEPILARRARLRERAWKWAWRHPAAAAVLAIVGVSAGLLLGGSVYYNARLRRANLRLAEALDQARTAREQAQASARTALTQRNLAVNAFRELIFGVQDKLKASPGTMELSQSLLKTATEGLAELARSTEEAAPDLDRAVAHQRLAEVYFRVGRDIEGRRQLERSLELAQGLAARSPRDPDVLECLGVDYYQLAWFVLQTGDPVKAEVLSRRGVAACEAVAALDPARPLARQYRIKNAFKLGHTFLWRDMLPDALAAFDPALGLARRWAAEEPANATARRLVQDIEVKLGDAYWLLGHDWAVSRAHYREAIAIARGLVAEEPDSIANQAALVLSLINCGEYSLRAGHPDEAGPLVREALQIANQLAKADPDVVSHQLHALEAQAVISGIEMAEGRYPEAAGLIRPAIERLQKLKDEGKLEGQPNYVRYIQYWKGNLAYYEAAPRALKDLASVRSQPPEMAIKLLRFRARALKGRGDGPGLVATVDAAAPIPCLTVNEMLDLAAFYAECITGFDAIRSAGPPAPDNVAVRSRCVDLGLAALSRAIDHGYRDAPFLEADDVLKPLRAHPGFRPLVDRLHQSRPAQPEPIAAGAPG
jgi:eukaryotic-like serine/threonine-protein kinase